MQKKKKLMFIVLGIVSSVVLAIVGMFLWVLSLSPAEADREKLADSRPDDMTYLTEGTPEKRGKVLAVVTSTRQFGNTQKTTGYELTELSRAYYVFQANGFEVDIASPKGGKPPVVLDDEDMGAFDFAFLNDSLAQAKVERSLALSEVSLTDYQALFFVGGKGTMFDFPGNPSIQQLVKEAVRDSKVIGAVCHGPAAFIGIKMEDGTNFLDDKKLSGFTNSEELFIIPEAGEIFPYLLQDKLIEEGADFTEGTRYLENVVTDGLLVTGQNPWSTWSFAESMVASMGFQPKDRERTPEENSIQILKTYDSEGYQVAKKEILSYKSEGKTLDTALLGMHWVVACVDLSLVKFWDIFWLLTHAAD